MVMIHQQFPKKTWFAAVEGRVAAEVGRCSGRFRHAPHFSALFSVCGFRAMIENRLCASRVLRETRNKQCGLCNPDEHEFSQKKTSDLVGEIFQVSCIRQ